MEAKEVKAAPEPPDRLRKAAEDLRLDLDIPGDEAEDAERRIHAALVRVVLSEREACADLLDGHYAAASKIGLRMISAEVVQELAKAIRERGLKE